jgi:hypothetical protein
VAALTGCGKPGANPSRATPAEKVALPATPVVDAAPMLATVRAMSSKRRQAYLGDARWAVPATAYRQLLDKVVTVANQLDGVGVAALDAELKKSQQALSSAAGAEFPTVRYALDLEYFQAQEQREALQLFSSKAYALQHAPAPVPATVLASPAAR